MTVVENNVNTGNAATAADVADERPVVLKVDHVAKSFRLPTEPGQRPEDGLPELDQGH